MDALNTAVAQPVRVDRRRRELRAVKEATAILIDALGGDDAVTDFQRAECQRLGELVAIARAQRLRRAMGDTSISIGDLVLLENTIDRALRSLKVTDRPRPPQRRRAAHYGADQAGEGGEFEKLISGLPDSNTGPSA